MRALTQILLAAVTASMMKAETGQTDAIVQTGNTQVVVTITHDIPPPYLGPDAPPSFHITNDTGTTLSFSWAAVRPALGRSIDHYEILLNGSKIASTTDTSYGANYDGNSDLLKFFTVVAVDDLGRRSVASEEIRAPRNVPYATLEVKEFTGTAEKFGVFSQGNWYRTYNQAYDRTGPIISTWYDVYGGTHSQQIGSSLGAVTAAITVDRITGEYTRTASGHVDASVQVDGQTISGSANWVVVGTEAVPDDPDFRNQFPTVGSSVLLPDMSDDDWHLHLPTPWLNPDPRGTSQWGAWLSDLFTDEELHVVCNQRYTLAAGAAGEIPWNYGIGANRGTLSSAVPLDGFSPSAAEYRKIPREFSLGAVYYGSGIGSMMMHGSFYHIVNNQTFAADFTFGEATYLDGVATPTVVIRQVHLGPGETSATYRIDAPAAEGGTVIATDLRATLWTPSLQPTPNQPRVFDADGLFTGEIGLLNLTYATSATYSVSGDPAIQLMALDQYTYYSRGAAAAILAAIVIPPGTDLVPYLNAGQLIGVVGVTPGSAVINVDVGGATVTQKVNVYAVPTMAVDADRDGVVAMPPNDLSADYADQTTADRPYRFWLNDDNDLGEEKSGSLDDLPVTAGTGSRNCDDNQVNGIRDLVDFFPVCLDVKQLLTVLPPGINGVAYYLKQEDSALGIVFTSYTRAQAFDYLRGTPSGLDTGFGPNLAQKAGEATVTKITADGVDLFATSPAFQARIQNNDGGVILVEASKATTKPLVLEVRKGTDVIATVQLAIKIDPVETMFRYYNIRSQAHGTAIAANNQGPNYGATTPSDAPNDPFQDVPSRKNAVFVHGYNVNSQQAQGSAAEMFKRLYWGRSKAKFYAVLWRGDDGQGEGPLVPAGATPDYHRNVGHAWQQGPYLRDLLTSLTGDTAVIAHSLGNMVTEVALTYERDPSNAARLRPAARPPGVKNYFAIDAALPLEAVRGTAITTNSKALMRHPDWADFDERLWPTDWHSRFPSTDARSTLTWVNVFAGLGIGTNFYSSGEEVLANPDDGDIPVLDTLLYSGFHAWVVQEKLKGGAARFTHPAEAAAIQFLRSRNGGWVTNTAWYVPIVPTPTSGPTTRQRFPEEAQESGVPSVALAGKPFFQPFQASESGGFYPGYQGSRLIAAAGDANADDEARKLVTVAKCLGEAIPALSLALGSNSSTKFDELSGNFDLNDPAFRNGWPSSRSKPNWRHSDCLNVAYTFNFPLYERMTTDGGLK